MAAVRAPGAHQLLERSSEIAALRTLAADTAAGSGRVCVIEGEAGIGKSRLLTLAAEIGAEAGLAVSPAAARALERPFAFGVARQLLERPLLGLDARRRRRVLERAAAPAAEVLGVMPARSRPPSLPNACHALYWLVAHLADSQPLLLRVDDLQWCDEPSLHWMLYLAHRLEATRVGLVVASRRGEPGSNDALLQELDMAPATTVLRPRPLSRGAVQRWLRESVGEVDEAFVASCHRRTAGNPFLLSEVVAALGAVTGPAPVVEELERLQPERVQEEVTHRLASLPPTARAVAGAAAVLGPDATQEHVRRLAGVTPERAAEAADLLTRLRIFAGGFPLEFVHGLVADAVLDALGPVRREQLHREAARALHAKGQPDVALRVAGHLLVTAPNSEDWVVQPLLAAAEAARGRGDPGGAVKLLERALAEPPPPGARVQLLRELGRAKLATGDADALACLREAQAAIGDQDIGLIREISSAALAAGRLDEAAKVLVAAREALSDADREARMRLEGELAALVVLGLHPAKEMIERLEALAAEVEGATEGERLVLAGAAFLLSLAGRPIELCAGLGQRALQGGLLADQTADAPAFYLVLDVILDAERYDLIRRALDEASADAQRRASLLGFVQVASFRAYLEWFAGDLPAAAAAAADVLNATRDGALAGMNAVAVAVLVDTWSEQGELTRANDLLAEQGFAGPLAEDAFDNSLLFARGNLRLAEDRLEEALDDFAELDRRDAASGRAGLAFLWRASAARALAARGERERAVELAREEQERARAGGPRPRGVALGAAGVALGGDAGIAALEESVELLAGSPARLEHARSLINLGAALRRRNRRRDGAAALREGLTLAERCEAHALAGLAREELLALGAKARRLLLSGAAALTPSERRVALLARDGLSNVEIAQRLFITRKTVEAHLGRAYDKLGIRSRNELDAALAPAEHPAARSLD